MMMRKLILVFFLLFFQSADSQVLPSGDFNTDLVIETSISGIEDCINYCFTGICIWVVCTIYSCDVDVTAQIEHNLPDLVITSFQLPGDNPYIEAKNAYGASAKSALQSQVGLLGDFSFLVGGGDDFSRKSKRRTHTNDTSRKSNIVFKEVSIIGNPAMEAFQESSQGGATSFEYICASDTTGLFPYYQSELDGIAWRTGLAELAYIQTYNPLSNVIGTIGINYWGRIYPRQGFLHQRNDAKAGWVMAGRALHFTTRDNQPHVYSKPKIGGAFTLDKRRWQQLSPHQSTTCSVIGQPSTYGLESNRSRDFKNGWLYWGRHQCCVPGTGVLVGQFEVAEICI